MRRFVPAAAALLLAATGPALAGGGITVDRVSTRAVTYGSVGQVSALEAASQAADAKASVVVVGP
jgi:hypothetical protein